MTSFYLHHFVFGDQHLLNDVFYIVQTIQHKIYCSIHLQPFLRQLQIIRPGWDRCDLVVEAISRIRKRMFSGNHAEGNYVLQNPSPVSSLVNHVSYRGAIQNVNLVLLQDGKKFNCSSMYPQQDMNENCKQKLEKRQKERTSRHIKCSSLTPPTAAVKTNQDCTLRRNTSS